MRFVALLSLALLASNTQAQSAAASPPLVGMWESLDLPRTGMGPTLIFSSGGSAVFMVGVIANGRYTRDGARVQITGDDGSLLGIRVTITGDTLTQVSADSTVQMMRVPGFGPDTGLVGKWHFEVR